MAASGVDPHRLDRFVIDQMDRAGIPGVAYAVVGRDGVQHQATFGEDRWRPVVDTTPFLWGSVAKPVAASLVVTMASTGELDLDARVTSYLPDFAMADDEAQAITLRHLLSQTGGVPERMDLTDHYDDDRTHRDVLAELAGTRLVAGVGGRVYLEHRTTWSSAPWSSRSPDALRRGAARPAARAGRDGHRDRRR